MMKKKGEEEKEGEEEDYEEKEEKKVQLVNISKIFGDDYHREMENVIIKRRYKEH